MRLRAVISLEVEASDFADAAAHQVKIKSIMENLQKEYECVEANLKQIKSPANVQARERLKVRAMKRSAKMLKSSAAYDEYDG